MTPLQDKLEQILELYERQVLKEENGQFVNYERLNKKEATQAILTALEAWVTSARPEKSHVTARYSTSEVDRLAFDLAFDSGVDQYHTKLIASLNSNKGEK